MPSISLIANSKYCSSAWLAVVRLVVVFVFYLSVMFVCPSTTLSFIPTSYFLLLFLLRDCKTEEAVVTSHVLSFPGFGSQLVVFLGPVEHFKNLFCLGAICL